MDLDVPETLGSLTEDMYEIENRDENILWKVKGLAGKLTYRLFSKFSDDELEGADLDFANSASAKFS